MMSQESTMTTDKYGNKHWKNNKGELHRTDGPAVENSNGSKAWFQNGKFHRTDGPAIESSFGSKAWYQDGKFHRTDGPAVEDLDGYKSWYQDGKRLDFYYPNFGCFKPKTKEEALKRLNRKPRPFSHNLYLKDIEDLFGTHSKV